MEKVNKNSIISEGGNLIYNTTGQHGERKILLVQKDTPENRYNLRKLLRDECQRQYEEILDKREKNENYRFDSGSIESGPEVN